MAGTTQYFGVTYPTSTDYVKDGATAIEAVADGFDAAVAIPVYNTQTGTSYTFVLLDAAKVVTSNNASAVTFTVPPQASVVWEANTTLTVANYGAGALTIAGGAGVTITNATAIAQYTSAKLIRTASNAWTLIPFVGGASYGTATGGSSSSITDGGISYTLLTFTSSGTLTVTKAGLFDVLIQAASGAGGSTTTTLHSSGGGGGGSVTIATVYLDANQTITLGAGGVAASGASGTMGGKTTFGSILTGAAGSGGASRSAPPQNGGCAGGTSNGNDAAGGVFTTPLGVVGGNGGISTQDAANGGAGGGAGGNATTSTPGAGITSTFTGTSTTYGAGGGTSGGTAGNANGSGGSGRNNASSGLGGAGSNAKVFVRFKA